MYQPLSREDSIKEIQRLEQKGIGFDKAIQNIALLHYMAEKNNVPAKYLLEDLQLEKQTYPALT